MSPRTMTIDAPSEAADISDLDFWSPILSDPEDWSEFQGMLDAVAAKAEKGGEGSGHFEHEGRPGKIGGSQPGDPKPEEPEKKPKPRMEPRKEEVISSIVDTAIGLRDQTALKEALEQFPLDHIRGLVKVSTRPLPGYSVCMNPFGLRVFCHGTRRNLGLYLPGTGNIRIAPGLAHVSNHEAFLRTIAHEIGHHVAHTQLGKQAASAIGNTLIDLIRSKGIVDQKYGLEELGLGTYSISSGTELWADTYSVWRFGSQAQWRGLMNVALEADVDLEGILGLREGAYNPKDAKSEAAWKRHYRLVSTEVDDVIATSLEPVEPDTQQLQLTPWLYVEIGDGVKGAPGLGHQEHEGIHDV